MYRSDPLSLEHQKFVEDKLLLLNYSLSEYNFANLYLFRHVHQYEIVRGNLSYILGNTYDKKRYIMPLDKELTSYREVMEKEQALLFPIPEQMLGAFLGNHWLMHELQQDQDYIYKREKFLHYPGRQLAGRRNLVKQFTTLYSSQVVSIDKSNIQEAILVLDEWHKKHTMADDYKETLEALTLFNQLQFSGVLVRVEDKPIAFALGTCLTKECYLVHFAKALPGLTGIYQFLYQAIAKNIDHQFIWMNLEADLDIKGLRDAKRAYEPDLMGKKWRIMLDAKV